MPTAVLHLLVPIILAALFRDFVIRDRKKFPLHYVLIAGIGGILPDIDIIFYLFLRFFGFGFEQIHRTYLHSLFVPLIFLIISFLTIRLKNKTLGKHKLKVHWIFLAMFFGIITHLFLDAVISGNISLLAPISNQQFGLNIVNYLPKDIKDIALPLAEGILLLFYLIYLEWKHKLSDFI